MGSSKAVVLNSHWASPPEFDSAGLVWDLRFCISHRLLGDADAAGLWVTLEF